MSDLREAVRAANAQYVDLPIRYPSLVIWTDVMRKEFVRLYWLGRDLDIIAHRVGVGRRELAKEKRRLGLKNRRHIKGFYGQKFHENETPFDWRS